MARETNVTPASTPSPTPATAQTNLWVTAALVWHGVLGIGLLIFGVLTLFGVTDVFGVIQLPQYGSFFIQFVVFLVTAALGGVQLLNLRGLQAHWSRARIVSVGINFAGFVLLLFITFRQLTCTNVCAADMFPFAPDRMALWVPFFIITVAFGVMTYGMWRRDVADLYGETEKQREALNAYVYISPYLLTASIFTLGLLIYAFSLSFTDYGDRNLYAGQPADFVGTANYSKALTDSEFLTAISNVIWYAFIVVVFQTIISLALALMMNARFAGRRWFRTLFYAPSVTSSVVISLIFLWLFNGRGIVNYIMYEVLDLTEPLGNLGLRTPNTNWLNTADRLGDLTYLKPFFDNSWYFLLGIPLLIVIVMALVRVSLWLRDRALNGRAVLASGLAALATLVVLVVVLGVLAGATGAASGEAAASAAPIQGSVVIATLLVSLGFGLAGGLVINFLELEPDRSTATRSAALGVIAAVLVALPVACLVGLAAAPEAFALTGAVQVTAYTLMVVPLIVGPLTAAFTADVSHRLFMADVRLAMLKPQPGGNMARRLDRWVSWMGTGLLTVLAIWCVVMVLAAAATTGLEGPKNLGDEQFGALLLRGPSVAFLIIMLLNIFTTSPTFMIMFLAALQDVPGQLYEAAQIDGANRWQQFWQITLPVLRPVMLLIVVLGTIGTFQIFDQVHVMTAGGPLNTTLTPVYLIYTKAIGDQRSMQMGYAAAMAFILGAIIFVITYIQRNYIEKGTEQY